MNADSVTSVLGVVSYLHKYAMRFEGQQPLAIGVTPEAWTKIAKEVSGSKDDKDLPMQVRIYGVLVVPA